jgi:putative tricarboxylic transport membrane protein
VTPERGVSRGPSTRHVGIIVGLVLFGIGVLVVADNARIGAGWASDGPQAGYFPLRIGVLIAVCSVIVIVQAFRRRSDQTIFVEWAKLIPVGKILFPLILYIAAMQYLGLYVASTLFVGGLMRWLGRYSWTKSVLVPLVMSAIIFWLFEYQFTVPLPKGPLEQWFGY